jgi:tetratricopeptide (TPR) repeat protein
MLHRGLGLTVLALGIACGGASESADQSSASAARKPAERAAGPAPLPETVTYTEHVAAILDAHCVTCHRPGEAGPFPLTTHEQVRKHASQIVEVTQSGFMPPWLPAPTDVHFVGERRLGERDREILARWVEQGAPEGDPDRRPAPPRFAEGWRLGEPDLVVELPAGYTLPADGVDVYRNFVLPIPLEETRFVRAIELRPGNLQVVHHAVIRVDPTRSSRQLDAREPELGFDGMVFGRAHMPSGHFLGWTPGRTPHPGSDDESWRLDPGTDFVLQMHMRPTGKPEPIGAQIGVYFAEHPPKVPYLALLLSSRDIDIAPGESDFRTTDSYVLPVDVRLISIYPHAHYLGKRLEAHATLPNGTRRWLIRIPAWDFNWQDQYRYVEPITLPKGTTITMDFSHDNSADNPLNPADPPVRVRFGPQSTDEMSELILEVTPVDPTQVTVLDADYRRKFASMEIEYYAAQLEREPENAMHMAALARQYQDLGEHEKALTLLDDACAGAPKDADLLVAAAASLAALERHADAASRLERALRLDADHPQAHNNLGNAYRALGRHPQALSHFEKALTLDPTNANAHNNAGVTYKQLGRRKAAIEHLRQATQIEPGNALFHGNLGNALREASRDREALAAYDAALRLRPGWATALNYVAWILATSPDESVRDPQSALRLAEQAARATQLRNPDTLDTLAAAQAALGHHEAALQTIDRAIELATQAELAHALPGMRERRAAYARGEAWIRAR